ncbi:MAG: hypothetical protein HY701_13650 [Gemmatimonadetes bacterium]|nr:hypothetical protein [Gemmatimonadota bacterium]
MHPRYSRLLLLMSVAGFAACDDGALELPGPASLSVGMKPSASSTAIVQASVVPVSDGAGRAVLIQQVQFVLTEAKLEWNSSNGPCTQGSAGCQDFMAGPVLVDLPLDGSLARLVEDVIPEGIYKELDLKIEEPDDDNAPTRAFWARHPDWPRDRSVRVRGTFDARDGRGPQPFDVFVKIGTSLDLKLEPNWIVSPELPSLNLTVLVDVQNWFRSPDGTLMDPRAIHTDSNIGGRVESNIKTSFDAFEDNHRRAVRPG